jgi:hypothetical protein
VLQEGAMDRNQILNFKASLESELDRLEKQRAGILSTIESLTKMEASFFGDAAETPVSKGPQRISVKIEDINQQRGPTSRARIMRALGRLSGKFSRIAVFNEANSDGLAEININTFGGIFAELVKNGIIKEVDESSGSQPGTYMNAGEYEIMKEKAPIVSVNDLF